MSKETIYRQAAIDALGGNEPVGDPSKWDDDDVVKMWERIRIINIINKLPSAQPERKKGTYTVSGENAEWYCWYATCNECGKEWMGSRNFCPNCGADMRGEHDG